MVAFIIYQIFIENSIRLIYLIYMKRDREEEINNMMLLGIPLIILENNALIIKYPMVDVREG